LLFPSIWILPRTQQEDGQQLKGFGHVKILRLEKRKLDKPSFKVKRPIGEWTFLIVDSFREQICHSI